MRKLYWNKKPKSEVGGVAESEGNRGRLVELEFQGVAAVVTAGASAVAALSLEIETRDVSEAVTDPRAEESDFGFRMIRSEEGKQTQAVMFGRSFLEAVFRVDLGNSGLGSFGMAHGDEGCD